jgi:hypothetical protein
MKSLSQISNLKFQMRGALLLLCLHSALCTPHSALAQTPVLFPLSQMFGGASYTKTFTIQAAQSFISNGTNAWIGANTTVTPTGGTNPIVYLTPNTYLVQFPDATYPWRIAVPNTTNLLNALNLSTGPLPTFLVQPYMPLVSGPGVIVTNLNGTNFASIDSNYVLTAGVNSPAIGNCTWTNGVFSLSGLWVDGVYSSAYFSGDGNVALLTVRQDPSDSYYTNYYGDILGDSPCEFDWITGAIGGGGYAPILKLNGGGLTLYHGTLTAPAFAGNGLNVTNIQSVNIIGGLNLIVTNLCSATVSNRLYFTNGILVKFTSP